METGKKWYESIGVWGGITTIFVSVLELFKIKLDDQMKQDLTTYGLALGTLIAGAVALYGRIRAKKKIS